MPGLCAAPAQCLGGNSVQDAAVLGQVDTCTTPCAGDATTTCGGEDGQGPVAGGKRC